jgi:hypothetical protein
MTFFHAIFSHCNGKWYDWFELINLLLHFLSDLENLGCIPVSEVPKRLID